MWNKGQSGKLYPKKHTGLRVQFKKLIAYFMSIVDKLIWHVYIKRSQALSFEKARKDVEEEERDDDDDLAVLQIDFAENYTCESQDGIKKQLVNVFMLRQKE